MIKRNRDADAIMLAVAKALSDEEAVVDEVVVRQRRALGEARGAGGVLDVDRIVELQRTLPRTQLGLGDALAGAKEGVPVLVEAEDVSHLSATRADVVEHRPVEVL